MSKIDLLDVTFVIPYFRDSVEREENLKCIIRFLNQHFQTTILIMEVGTVRTKFDFHNYRFDSHHFNKIHDGVFHRTKVINEGIKLAKTPYIGIYDTDVVFEPGNILKAVQTLRDGATLAYPYDGPFVNIERSYIKDGVIKERASFVVNSVGGACFLNKEDYKKCGYENEHYISHCPDDVDRFHRVKTLGYRIERVKGKCYHIEHPIMANSIGNKFTEHNNNEYMNITSLSKEDLEKEISTWEWAK